jgi:site-specific DNA recombinase
MPPMIVRVATLTRRSTDDTHQPFSIEAQDAKLAAYIQSQDNWQHLLRFTDDMSGATITRPGLQQALAAARTGRYDLLLVYKVDRLARSIAGLARILDELDGAGIRFCSATEPFDTSTAAGRMLVQMLGVFAEFERRTIIDRVVAGMERKAAHGAWVGGSRPFGYTTDPTTSFLTPRSDQAPLVPVIFDLYANKRLGANAIAAWLNQRGYRTRAGRPWGYTAVLTVLRNRAYLGEICFRGTYYPAPHPPLVDPDLFQATQQLLAERGGDYRKRRSNGSDYLLSGLLVCARCGKHFVGASATGNRYRYRYYTCFSRQRYGSRTCSTERLPADELDAALLEALLATYQRTDLFRLAVQAAATRLDRVRQQHHDELQVVEAELRRTEEAIQRYLLAFEAGTLADTDLAPRVQALTVKTAELQHRQAELTAAIDQIAAQPPSQAILAHLRERIHEAVTRGPMPAKKALVQALVHEIRVEGRDAIIPTFRVPTLAEPGQKVRTLPGLVGVTGFEPVASAV